MDDETAVFDGICYKQNYLKEVVVRIDLLNPLEGIEERLPKRFSNGIMKRFPIAEPQEIITQEVIMTPEGVEEKNRQKMTQWTFHGKDREKSLTLFPHALFISYKAYQSYEILRQEFMEVVTLLIEHFADAQGSRLGLRYINRIDLDEENPLSWEAYLDERMLGLFSFPPQSQVLARVLHSLEFNLGDLNLRYQFGMHNPDFPAPIRQKTFILDFDAYYHGILELGEIGPRLDKFHRSIQELFELSITERLREKMNG